MSIMSVMTFILCIRRSCFYIPPELQYLILVVLEVQPPKFVDHLTLLDKVDEEYCYQFDTPQYFPLGAHPSVEKCTHYAAFRCIELYLELNQKSQLTTIGDTQSKLYFGAAHHGHLHLLQWLLIRGIEKVKDTYAYAAMGGHRHILQWLWDNDFPKSSYDYACSWAVREGHSVCLQWLIDHDFPRDQYSYVFAAKIGSLNILQQLWDNGFPRSTRDACRAAARHGNQECLHWLIIHNFRIDDDLICEAAAGGHIHILEYLIKRDFDKNCQATEHAARHGHLACLQWLVANGFGKNANACQTASEGGHSECLHWMIINGFPKSPRAIYWAIHKNHEECLTLLIKHKFPEY